MRILLLTRSFNSLTQRLYLELASRGHEIAVEYDIADSVTEEAVALFEPALVLAPFLKRAIPASVWSSVPCFIVHPGIVGDRGPSALDWAIMNGAGEWGVTVLQAVAQMDAGPVWATASFTMRDVRKSSLYRNEVTEAATRAVVEALERFLSGTFTPRVVDDQDPSVQGRSRPQMTQAVRSIDWRRDDTQTVLRKVRAADGAPGVLDRMFGVPCYLFDAHPEQGDPAWEPGAIVARHDEAMLRATRDGAVWIGHVRRADTPEAFKLPAVLALPDEAAGLPPAPARCRRIERIRYEEADGVGYLHFAFYNGAMSTVHCERLLDAYRRAAARPTRVLVLLGGRDFWSNGIHLNVIEAARSPADESWRNINAIDDLTEAIIETRDRVTVAAMQGNAGAGGVFMALAADHVWAREGVVLNPHYKNMGNLYGSEYWTYLLPRRVTGSEPREVMAARRPVGARAARDLGLVDAVLDGDHARFLAAIRDRAAAMARDHGLDTFLAAKRVARERDERAKPLAAYRADELAAMRRNFYGFDPSYHVARAHFVHNVPPSWTPRHLATHRDKPPRRAGHG